MILGIFGTSQQAEAATVIISDQASCEAQGGVIKTNKCFFSGSLTIPSGDSWTSTMFFAVHDLTVEGELNAPNGMDADKLTNKGTITTVNLISIGPSNFWVNDCGGKINLLPNGIINFDAAGTNHGVIKGDSTTAITTPLSSNTVVNSGIIQSSISLNKVSIKDVSSPCPKDKKAIIRDSSTTQEQNENLQIKETKNLRNCKENQICAFPGEYLRYRNTDSYDGFSEIAIVNFKEKISDRTIRVFVDGFGSKPLTYELNTKTGQEKNAQFGVDRPFNLVEPVPMYIGQKVFRIYVTFETTLTTEETGTFKNMERTFMVGTYEEEGLFVERKYDKETGVLVSQVENYELDGNWYKSESTLIDTNIFSAPTKIATTKTTTKETSIPKIVPEPTPDGISDSIIVEIKRTSYQPSENIEIFGTVKELLSGFPVTLQVIAANGNLVTIQQLEVGADKKFSTELTTGGSLWKSQGTYTIKVQYGTNSRTAEATFDYADGARVAPILESEKESVIQENVIESASTSVPTQPEQKESPSTKIQESSFSDSDEVDPTNVAIGAFIVLGIPAIIIGLIIWKIKQRRKKNQISSKWEGV